jgi:hypothetical protein
MRVQQYRGLLAILILVLLMACSESAVQPTIGIALSAERVTLQTSEVKEFTATVTGTEEDAVIWSATGGSITGEGKTILYGAPDTAGEFILTATSSVDTSKSAEVIITVISNEGPDDEPGDDKPDDEGPDDETPLDITVSLTPASATLGYGQTITLTATVTGTDNLAVNWQAGCGRIDGSGLIVSYVAPNATGSCSVTVTSQVDTSKQAQASFEVFEPATRLWLHKYEAQRGTDLVLDSEGAVIVLGHDTGNAASPFLLLRYDHDDTEVWRRSIGREWARPSSLAIDEAGNFYIAGTINGQRTAFLAKYDSQVSEVWFHTYDEFLRFNDIAVSPDGALYLATSRDFLVADVNATLLKVSPDGDVVWERSFGALDMNGNVSATSVSIDTAGFIYVAASDRRNKPEAWSGIETGSVLKKFDSSGNTIWTSAFDVASTDPEYSAQATSILVDDRSDVVYLTSRGEGGLYLAQYSLSGSLNWQKAVVSETDRLDSINGIAVDDAGNIYLTGSVVYAFGGYITDEVFEVLLARFNSAGEELWLKRFGAGDDTGRALISTPRGLYLTGSTHAYPDGDPDEVPLENRKMFLAKFVP